ncbi:MAG: L-rhamnose isomerase [Planctomycetes bacterium]|nr:L-rhamnose isomerase [Planctomycetota bacterium]
MSRFETAKAMYAEIGVDVDAALRALDMVHISMHCWQGDDVTGFESSDGPTGGIAATGNYPGKARNFEELCQDIRKAYSLIPGKHRLNLHAIYPAPGDGTDRDKLEPKHFSQWVDFAKAEGIGLDFNPTFFSHPKAGDTLTLSHPDAGIRRFWIDHARACRRIAASFGKELGTPALNNIWVPDGYKNIPADRLGPRLRLKASLDEIYSEKLDKTHLYDSVESKLFGIGVEAYTVGSHEFYMNYAAYSDVLYLLDLGHFHPTESVADKLSAVLAFSPMAALHVSRPIRWDSDHVIILDDELKELAKEIVRTNALDKVLLGLDFFDASINRVGAWVTGMRNMQKAFLHGLLMPHEQYRKLQDEGRFGELMALSEDLRLYPLGDIWDHYCETKGVPVREKWFADVQAYERDTLSKRR